ELEGYPRYSFEQGVANSFFFSEEPLSEVPHKRKIRISDRATLTSLLTDFDGYTLSTGILTPEMQDGIVTIPLDTDITMTVGYLIHKDRVLDGLLAAYIDNLRTVIKNNPLVARYLEE
ncbi:MAG: LysR family transcriptional regulator, partial [Bacteroidales bacterium]